MIKSNPVGVLLGSVFILLALGTSYLTFTYVQSLKKLQGLQAEVLVVNRNQTLLQNLAAESLEYSKRNPAIDPILQGMGIKPKGAPQTVTPTKAPSK